VGRRDSRFEGGERPFTAKALRTQSRRTQRRRSAARQRRVNLRRDLTPWPPLQVWREGRRNGQSSADERRQTRIGRLRRRNGVHRRDPEGRRLADCGGGLTPCPLSKFGEGDGRESDVESEGNGSCASGAWESGACAPQSIGGNDGWGGEELPNHQGTKSTKGTAIHRKGAENAKQTNAEKKIGRPPEAGKPAAGPHPVAPSPGLERGTAGNCQTTKTQRAQRERPERSSPERRGEGCGPFLLVGSVGATGWVAQGLPASGGRVNDSPLQVSPSPTRKLGSHPRGGAACTSHSDRVYSPVVVRM